MGVDPTLNVLLISTYELGRQPFGLASPAAWLRREGCTVTCLDLSVEKLPEPAVASADLIAFYLPMHTATRLATGLVDRVRTINPGAHLCFYGLYAPLNEAYLRRLGGDTILGGEFEQGLVALVRRLATARASVAPAEQAEPLVSLDRQRFLVPDRDGLPPLDRYARLVLGPNESRTVGYTEATRGCKHLCRHCSIVPVYGGRFRVVQREVVLEDIRRQVRRGARHITFGDPDFMNGPAHSMAIVRALHEEFPDLGYDVTVKVEHLLQHREHLDTLRETGCLFVTSAVEALDDRTLGCLRKNHTRGDFLEVVRLMRRHDLALSPTFVTFTPWTTPESYVDLLEAMLDLDLVDNVAPVQYAIRLLIAASSPLLELQEVRALVGAFDERMLIYPWDHPDPRVDRLCDDVTAAVKEGQRGGEGRREIFRRVWETAHEALGSDVARKNRIAELERRPARAAVPYLTEPWYC